MNVIANYITMKEKQNCNEGFSYICAQDLILGFGIVFGSA